MNPRIISNSEMNTWLKCKRKYYYTYDLNLMTLEEKKGKALRTGIYGHDVLKVYFDYLKENPQKFDEAAQTAMHYIAVRMAKAKDVTAFEIWEFHSRRLTDYFNHFARTHPNAQIIEVEEFHEMALVDEFSYGMKLDLYWCDPPFYYLTDHKFTYNFWPQTKIETMGAGQTSKYFMVLKNEGYQIDRAMINQIRYRDKKRPPAYTADELFRESNWTPTLQEMRNIIKDQLTVSREIIEHRNKSLEERENEATRSLGSESCEYCDFSAICVASLRGDDITADIEMDFTQNDYGYNKAEV